jgi:hypothetical protein
LVFSTAAFPGESEFGILRARERQIDIKVPKTPPFHVAVGLYHRLDLGSFRLSLQGKPLARVDTEDDVAPGKFLLTELGVFKFDRSAKGKTIAADYSYSPYRVAIFVAGDATGGDLRSILEGRFSDMGDETLINGDVDARVMKWRTQDPSAPSVALPQIAGALDAARLVVASLGSKDTRVSLSPYTGVAVWMDLEVYDLNTGRQLTKGRWTDSGVARTAIGWRKYRRQLAEKCVRAGLATLAVGPTGTR